jgi:AraC-like DNA-binding protein
MDSRDVFLCLNDLLAEPAALRLASAGRYACAADWRWDTRRRPLPDWDLWVVFAGRGRLEVQEECCALGAGTALLLRPGERLLATHQPSRPLTVYALHFTGAAAACSGIMPPHLRLADPTTLRSLMERAWRAWSRGDAAHADLWLRASLALLAEESSARPAVAGVRAHQQEMIETLCRDIRGEPGRDWRVGEMARRLHCTPDHFTRLFRRVCHMPPRAFLIRARMEAASSLLRTSSLPVGRIAQLLGYCDIYLFSRQFKTHVGCTPTAFRSGRTVTDEA